MKPRYTHFNTPRGWVVMDSHNDCRAPICQMVEEAEARIIAFALNAISEGGTLMAETPYECVACTLDHAPNQLRYTGPTDLVAR
jgi:hypothetical protein